MKEKTIKTCGGVPYTMVRCFSSSSDNEQYRNAVVLYTGTDYIVGKDYVIEGDFVKWSWGTYNIPTKERACEIARKWVMYAGI